MATLFAHGGPDVVIDQRRKESDIRKIINDIMVLNNKVIQSVGSRAESANAKVVDAIITSSTKVLHSFVNNQDQKNEQLINKIALENRKLLEGMAKVMAENRPGSPTQQARAAVADEKPVSEKMRAHGSVKLPKS